jgi:hypothetical protein
MIAAFAPIQAHQNGMVSYITHAQSMGENYQHGWLLYLFFHFHKAPMGIG